MPGGSGRNQLLNISVDGRGGFTSDVLIRIGWGTPAQAKEPKMHKFNSGGPIMGNVVRLPIMGHRGGEAILPAGVAAAWPTPPRPTSGATITVDVALEIVRKPDPARYTDDQVREACKVVRRNGYGHEWRMAVELEKAMKMKGDN